MPDYEHPKKIRRLRYVMISGMGILAEGTYQQLFEIGKRYGCG